MSPENLENIGNFQGWGWPKLLKTIIVISMKFCTRIIYVKKGVRKCNSAWWVGFSGKLFRFYSFKYWPHQFFLILYRYCNKKTLFYRNYILFEMDFSSFSSAWQFFDTKFSEISLRVFLKSRMLSSLKFLPKSATLCR